MDADRNFNMRILLKFGRESGPVRRARLAYAFRLFCAIYGHQPLLSPGEGTADFSLVYDADDSRLCACPSLKMSCVAGNRSPRDPAPPPTRFVRGDETTFLFYPPSSVPEPDWLGEIFDWVSCADEYSVPERDSVGRIPFSASYWGRHDLDPSVPYAAVAMRFLQRAVYNRLQRKPESPTSPVPAVKHFVISTHDIDYWPGNRLEGARRLAKNAGISLALSRRPMLSARQLQMAVTLAAGGRNPLQQIDLLVQRQLRQGLVGSYYFLTSHWHRRDANYTLNRPGVLEQIRRLVQQGCEVGVHGSYTCLEQSNQLAKEYDSMRALGVTVYGGRQHWLRFTLDHLLPSVEKAGARYDSSLGWSDRFGFRGGACFAFPPYDFEHESPANFLEIPLAMMDQSLHEGFRNAAQGEARGQEILATSRRYGWGGVSILWHPAAFGGGWFSTETGDAFWHLLEESEKREDAWLSASAFLQAVRQRYVEVGLLPQGKSVIRIDAHRPTRNPISTAAL